jgi:hypothetical protein
MRGVVYYCQCGMEVAYEDWCMECDVCMWCCEGGLLTPHHSDTIPWESSS